MSAIMLTYSGEVFDFDHPGRTVILIEDIAHSLAMQCRYTGHTKKFYSVAEHCYRMSVANLPGDPMSRLLHDSAEAYISDIAYPLKKNLVYGTYMLPMSLLEHRIVNVITKALGLFVIDLKSVKVGDQVMMATEVRDLMPRERAELFQDYTSGQQPLKEKIKPFSPKKAEKLFLRRYYELCNM